MSILSTTHLINWLWQDIVEFELCHIYTVQIRLYFFSLLTLTVQLWDLYYGNRTNRHYSTADSPTASNKANLVPSHGWKACNLHMIYAIQGSACQCLQCVGVDFPGRDVSRNGPHWSKFPISAHCVHISDHCDRLKPGHLFWNWHLVVLIEEPCCWIFICALPHGQLSPSSHQGIVGWHMPDVGQCCFW